MTSFAQVASIVTQLNYALTPPIAAPSVATGGPWRPPEWAGGKAALTLTDVDVDGYSAVYVFDTVIRASHERRAIATKNPVQSGAAVTDHIYVVPARLVIEVAMSDSMTSYNLSQFKDSSSRSVSAYQTLVALMKQRGTLAISTRLQQYSNMAITGIESTEEAKNKFGLLARVTFEEILFASVEAMTAKDSYPSQPAAPGVPQVTTGTTTGPVQPAAVTPALGSQYNVSGSSIVAASAGSVAGAGNWSSLNVNSLNA